MTGDLVQCRQAALSGYESCMRNFSWLECTTINDASGFLGLYAPCGRFIAANVETQRADGTFHYPSYDSIRVYIRGNEQSGTI